MSSTRGFARDMILIDPQGYPEAFVQYLRKGTPIRFETKNTNPTTHYIWRTRRDGKVRSARAEREGQIFSWDDPPEGEHPGDCLLYTSPSPRDRTRTRMPSSA